MSENLFELLTDKLNYVFVEYDMKEQDVEDFGRIVGLFYEYIENYEQCINKIKSIIGDKENG